MREFFFDKKIVFLDSFQNQRDNSMENLLKIHRANSFHFKIVEKAKLYLKLF